MTTTCAVCQAPKAPKTCELCQASVCKSCLEGVNPQTFVYWSEIPAKLSHANYCLHCYDEHVVPAIAKYEEIAEQAKDVYFLTKNYKGYVRVLQRHTKRVAVADCGDRRELILRLAFYAAELGMNAIIEADVESFKATKAGGYKSARWKGSALPAKVDGAQLDRAALREM